MQERDNSDLIRAAQRGDERSFEMLLRRYYDRIFAMAYSWCLNKDTAQDITQSACFAIVKHIQSYRHDAAFLTWVYRIVINTAKNMATYARRQKHYEMEYLQETEHQFEPSAHEGLEQQQMLQKIFALPEILKQSLLLVHVQGLNHRQAAKVLGCAEMTVSWRIHKARKLLGGKIQ